MPHPNQPGKRDGTGTGVALAPALAKPTPVRKPDAQSRPSPVTNPREPSQLRHLSVWSRVISVLAVAVGILVMTGWAFGIPTLTSVLPGLATMKPSTALCFIALGAAVWCLHDLRAAPNLRWLGMAASVLAIVVGALTILEYATGANLGVSQILFRNALLASGKAHPGRMSLATALGFVTLGLSLAPLHIRRTPAALRQAMALLGMLIGLIAVVGYVYGVNDLYKVSPYSSMALHTAVLMVLLGSGSLALEPNRSVMGVVSSEFLGGVMVRRVLPLIVLLPPLLGWLRWRGELAGWYGTPFGLTLFTLSNMVMLVALLVTSAAGMNRADQKRQQAAMADAHLAAIVESSLDAIISKDMQSIVTSWNRGAEQLFGYSTGEMIGQPITRLFPPELLAEETRIMHRVCNGERIQPFETKRLRKNGRQIDVSVTISPIKDGNGTVIGASKIARDITERNRAQEEIKRSLELAQKALKDLADQKFALDQHAIVAFTDVRGTITYVNDRFCEISQYSREELIGQNHRILNSGYHSRQFFQHMYRTITGGQVWHGEIKNRAKDGSYYWVDTTIVPKLNAEGKPEQYIAIRADITGRKQAEHALQHQADVLEQAQVMAWEMDGPIRFWTKGMERLYGYSRSLAIGQNPQELLRTEFPEPIEEILDELRDSGIWEGELVHYHRNGARQQVATVWVLQQDEGSIAMVIEADNDVSERMRVQAELQKRREELERSNRDLEQFAYAASHDLQEPLRAVSGCMQLFEARYAGKLDARADEFIHHAVDGATRMQKLIDDLLAYSRLGTHGEELQPVECRQAVENALQNLSVRIKESQATIECGELPLVSGDLSQLSLLFQNLIGNALKFHGPEASHIRIAARRQGKECVLTVSDNGIGIEAKYFERIFVIFQRLHTRTDYPGTGMGLALCKRIVERHGGRIWVDSKMGTGTTFSFTLHPVNAG